MGVKKIRIIFLRYVLLLAAGVIAAVTLSLGLYFFCLRTGFIHSLNMVDTEIEALKTNLQNQNDFSAAKIPPYCEYALFSSGGIYQEGSWNNRQAAEVWNTCTQKNPDEKESRQFTVIPFSDNVLVLKYGTTAQFNHALLSRYLPPPDLLLVILVILEILILLAVLSFFFGRYMTKKIDCLTKAAGKIEQQNLDFVVESSGILEIDMALRALDHMKQALSASLSEQWNADQLQQEQLAALAHDLKTPLTIVRGNTELLRETKLSGEQMLCTEYILKSSLQMQNYVQMLIETANSRNRIPLKKEETALSPFFTALKELACGLCTVKEIQLEWQCVCQSDSIFIDPELFLRVLVNIFSNAVEHTPSGGRIFFNSHEYSDCFHFTISDTGSGFSAELLNHAAEQFYMGDSSRNSSLHYGMGLYFADMTVKKHGGKMTLQNSELTGGAMVDIMLPK